MEKITKKHINAIKKGNHAVLMDCLDFLLDSYDENKWDLGYGACLSDMGVRAQRLAEYIAKRVDKSYKPRDIRVDELAKVIEDYFNDALKQ